MPLDIDSTIADIRARLRDLGEEVTREEISSMWRIRPPGDLQRALQALGAEPWARCYLLNALSDARWELRCGYDENMPATPEPRIRALGRDRLSQGSVPSIFSTGNGSRVPLSPSIRHAHDVRGRYVVCAKAVTLTFTQTKSAGRAVLRVDLAQSDTEGRFDSETRLSFTLADVELSSVLMVLTGHLKQASIEREGQTRLTWVDRGAQVRLSFRATAWTSEIVLGPADTLALSAMLADQIRKNLPCTHTGNIVDLVARTVGRITAGSAVGGFSP